MKKHIKQFITCLLEIQDINKNELTTDLSSKLSLIYRINVKWKWKSIDLSSKLSLTYGDNVNYYKGVHHPIPILPVGTGTPWQFSKQISKLSFQLSFQIYSLLAETEEETKTFFGWRVQKGGPHCEIVPKSTWLS